MLPYSPTINDITRAIVQSRAAVTECALIYRLIYKSEHWFAAHFIVELHGSGIVSCNLPIYDQPVEFNPIRKELEHFMALSY